MNDSHQSCAPLFWWIQEIIPHIEIYSTLDKKWMILSTILFNCSDEFKKLSHTLRFIAHFIRNKWLWKEFCSTILTNLRNYPTLRFIAHYIRNEWFWAEFCLAFLMTLWQYSIYREMCEIGWKMSEYKKR